MEKIDEILAVPGEITVRIEFLYLGNKILYLVIFRKIFFGS